MRKQSEPLQINDQAISAALSGSHGTRFYRLPCKIQKVRWPSSNLRWARQTGRVSNFSGRCKRRRKSAQQKTFELGPDKLTLLNNIQYPVGFGPRHARSSVVLLCPAPDKDSFDTPHWLQSFAPQVCRLICSNNQASDRSGTPEPRPQPDC